MTRGGFLVRVYGLWVRRGHILVSHEVYQGKSMIKFPGGGVEFGEGLQEALRREWEEECGLSIDICAHFHTTEEPIMSAFHSDIQVLPVYYRINVPSLEAKSELPELKGNDEQSFHWELISSLQESLFTFSSDRTAAGVLKAQQKLL